MNDSWTPEKSYIDARELIIQDFHKLVELTLGTTIVDAPDPEEVRAALDKSFLVAEPSRNLIYNLCLVMLVTQVEIFIEHLIDVILTTEPRRLKDLAGEKRFSTAELLDAQDYDSVMKLVREKVIEEVIRSKPHDMFIKHLGERFGLFKEEEFVCERLHADKDKDRWGLADIKVLWETRHKIVHEGELPADKDVFLRALVGCMWLETFLSFHAREKYHLPVDKADVLDWFANGWGIAP